MGIDRQRISTTSTARAPRSPATFTPCAIPFGCAGDDWYAFDPTAAKALLAEAGFPDGTSRPRSQFRDVVRGYLPDRTSIAQDLQAQLKTNLGIDADDRRPGVGHVP